MERDCGQSEGARRNAALGIFLLFRTRPVSTHGPTVNREDADVPGFSVFSRHDGIIRHFYSSEMGASMADPGQDPRGGPDLDPLWLMLDWTPQGRGTDWYPRLDYKNT